MNVSSQSHSYRKEDMLVMDSIFFTLKNTMVMKKNYIFFDFRLSLCLYFEYAGTEF